MNAWDVRKLAARLAKAEALVQAGAVVPVAGLEGYAVARNGTQMYLVRHAASRDPLQAQNCSCPDYQHRQGNHGQPCKHILDAKLAGDHNLGDGERVKRLMGKRSLALLNGKFDAVDRLDKELTPLAGAA